MCHNETTNIWSHLLGVIIFLTFIFYVVFFVGGISLTKPMDLVIDKFGEHHMNKWTVPKNLNSESIQKWNDEVERTNPEIFTSAPTTVSKYYRDSLLYDSVDEYLHLLIQK